MARDVSSASKRGGSSAIQEKRGYSSTLQNFRGQPGTTTILGGKITTGIFLLVSALASCELVTLVEENVEPGQTGTVRVTVNGFHADATAAGTLSGTVDGQDLVITLSPPSDGTSSGEATDAPVGTYDVTYTPPDDHGLNSADLGMETKSVTVSATDVGDLTWGLEPRTGTVLVTITGLSNAATEAGTIGGDLAITLSAPSAGTSTGESDEVLMGTYDVTYTAPANGTSRSC